ncbi:transposase [Streptomyces bomunensis]|uniref:Transposase n=1 Tax=Streptomyces montanisoli TaxID=2798581 RepID=A0A940M8M3_9ACTN|nr:transposase [Streptomyces montanisoli]MBP0456302.1 transposase [Streptomyces montanisoli]
MPRSDQRRWAKVYLRGLLLADGRKSVRRIADSMPVDRAKQSLQQFINQSPWDWEPVRARIAARVEGEIAPDAWVVHRVIIPKRGDRSVGVQRRFVPELGRTVNSQLVLGVSLASARANVPVDWRIALVGGWSTDRDLRRAAYIPDTVTAKPEWSEISDMLEEMLTRWELTPRPVVGDLRHLQDAAPLMAALDERGLRYVFQVDPGFRITAGGAPAAPPTVPRPVARAGKPGAATVRGHFEAVTTRLAVPHARPPAGPLGRIATVPRGRLLSSPAGLLPVPGAEATPRPVRIVAEVNGQDEFSRFWVTNAVRGNLDQVMVSAHRGVRNRQAMTELQAGFGLLDFEGRSYRGLHHHLTMVSAAFAYNVVGDAMTAAPV